MAGKSSVHCRKQKTDNGGNVNDDSVLDMEEGIDESDISLVDFSTSFSSEGNKNDLQAEEKLKVHWGHCLFSLLC